jgi:hypothetical protein
MTDEHDELGSAASTDVTTSARTDVIGVAGPTP